MATTDYASKIEKLLAQAEDASISPEEAQAYSAKAEELMVRWGVSDAELAEKRRKQKKGNEKIVQVVVELHGATVLADVHLGSMIAYGLGNVRAFKSASRTQTMTKFLYLIGHESDVARAQLLFSSLLLQSKAARAAWWKSLDNKPAGNQAFLAKRQFVYSFADEVGQRLATLRKGVHAEATQGTELVLKGRETRVDEWIQENIGKTRKGKGARGSWTGQEAGREAGRKADIGQASVKGDKAQVSA